MHLDLFPTPTAQSADIVLPVTAAFEAEGLKVGFEVSQEAESVVQLRAPIVPPVGEARSDIEIIFDLATRLGLGEHFFDGDVEAGSAHHLEPSGVSLRQLRDEPAGVRLPLETRCATAGGSAAVPPAERYRAVAARQYAELGRSTVPRTGCGRHERGAVTERSGPAIDARSTLRAAVTRWSLRSSR